MSTMKQQIFTIPLKMFTLIILLLGLCLVTKAKKFDEADCRPRPTAVAIDDSHKYKPYHIVLFRCSGTYNKISPSVKTCVAREQHDVLVNAINEDGNKIAVTVKNHTKCGAECAISTCESKDMIMDDCVCRCLTSDCESTKVDPNVQTGHQTAPNGQNSHPLPYIVGMAIVGLFAVFVLVFDVTLFVKKNGFIYTIKHSCCGRAPTMNKKNQPCENQSKTCVPV